MEQAFLAEELWFRSCFAEAESPGDWVLLTLTVDRDGLVSDIAMSPGPSRPPEPPPDNSCSEYDEYMGRCHRESGWAAAPPIDSDLWHCLDETVRRLRFALDDSGVKRRKASVEIKGTWSAPPPEPPRPSDELGK